MQSITSHLLAKEKTQYIICLTLFKDSPASDAARTSEAAVQYEMVPCWFCPSSHGICQQ